MFREIVKWLAISIPFVLIILIAVFFWDLRLLRDFSKAESAELVFGIDISGNVEFEKVVTLTDAERDELISYLAGSKIDGNGSFICTPRQISIKLSAGWKSVSFFPVTDGCSGLGVPGGRAVYVGAETMNRIIDFIQAHMPPQEEMPLQFSYEYYKNEWRCTYKDVE